MTLHSIFKSYQLYFAVIIVLILTIRCAIQVPPSGGAVDVTPPSVKESTPPNYSTKFKENRIKIQFNEYIVLTEMSNQVTISPIPEHEPDINIRGKSIQIDFFEKLKDSITYTINFGNSIRDYTVGNIFENYQYIFSTADKLDSSEIKGTVMDAFNLKPIEKCYVMIYDLDADSLPLNKKPLYFAKTDKSGYFEIKYIRSGKYKIFALVDENSNYLFDLPNESLAFIDTLVVSRNMIKKTKTDSSLIKSDSLLQKKDSIAYKKKKSADSIKMRTDSIIADSLNKMKLYKLFLFQEKDTVQQLLKATVSEEIKITFVFKQPVKNLLIKPLNVVYDTVWKLEERNSTNDTIIYWLLKIKTDSLILQVSDNGKILDTSELRIGKQKVIPGKGSLLPTKIAFKTNIDGNGFDYYNPLILSSSSPIVKYDLSLIKLMVKKDTVQDSLKFAAHFNDSINKSIQIDYKWNEGKKYTLFIPKGAFKDAHNNINDTIILPFSTKTFDDYGTLQVNVTLPDSGNTNNYIVQLLNDKENVCSEKHILKSQKVKFDFIDPGSYKIKVICDSNSNGKWDTGNYMEKLQPEKVYYYPSVITIKAGWDIIDQEVNLKKITP